MKINNVPLNVIAGQETQPYVVARDCGSDGIWYYGQYDNYIRAYDVAKEIGNGFVIPFSEMEF